MDIEHLEPPEYLHESALREYRVELDNLQREVVRNGFTLQVQAINAAIDKLNNSDIDGEDIKELISAIKTCKDLLGDLGTNSLPTFAEPISFEDASNLRTDWIIDKWLPSQTLTRFTGVGGLGKSFLTLQYASALALGIGDFALEKGVPGSDAYGDPIPSVYATWEDEPKRIQNRIAKICMNCEWAYDRYDDILEHLKILNLQTFGPAWGPEHAKHYSTRAALLQCGHHLLKMCEEYGARLLILDPLAAAYGSNENERPAVREFCATLASWAADTDSGVIIISHPSKSDSESSGSTDWQAAMRSIWKLEIVEHNLSNNGSGKNTRKGEEEESVKYYQLTNTKNSYDLCQPAKYLVKAENIGGKWEKLGGIWRQVYSLNDAINAYNAFHKTTTSESSHSNNGNHDFVSQSNEGGNDFNDNIDSIF